MNLEPEGITEHLPPRRVETPAVSIVLPTYNRARLLPRSVESVLAQTQTDLELIIVDDGSQDETRALVAEFRERDPRVAYLREQNLGLPRALNNGFRVARGEFWTWTSDDNRYFPEAIAALSRYLREHPAVALVYGDMLRRRRPGLVFEPPKYRAAVWRNNVLGAAFLYRAALARQVGEYDAALRMVEDYDYLLRLSYLGEVAHWPYIIYEYGEFDDSLTSTRRFEFLDAFERLLDKHARLGHAARPALSDLAIQISGECRRRGRRWDGVRLGAAALCRWPLNWRAYRSTALAVLAWIGQRGRTPDK